MFGDLFKLYEVASEYDFENTEWQLKYFDMLSKFRTTYKHIDIVKKFAKAVEHDNIEKYEKWKAERWMKGE